MVAQRNAKAINLDTLFRKYAVAKEKRIDAFGRRLEKLTAELNKGDLAEIPTDKLFKMTMALSDRLMAEEIPLRLSKKISWAGRMSLDDKNRSVGYVKTIS